MLTLQNRVNLNNLMTIRSLGAGTLTARAWETLRAAVQGVAPTRAMAPPTAPDSPAPVGFGLPLMRRGAERC